MTKKIAFININNIVKFKNELSPGLIEYLRCYDEVWLITSHSKALQQRIHGSDVSDFRLDPLIALLNKHGINSIKVSTPVDRFYQEHIPGHYYHEQLSVYEEMVRHAASFDKKEKNQFNKTQIYANGLTRKMIEETEQEDRLASEKLGILSFKMINHYLNARKEQLRHLIDHLFSNNSEEFIEISYFDDDKENIDTSLDIENEKIGIHSFLIKPKLTSDYFDTALTIRRQQQYYEQCREKLISFELLTKEDLESLQSKIQDNLNKIQLHQLRLFELLSSPESLSSSNRHELQYRLNSISTLFYKNITLLHRRAQSNLNKQYQQLLKQYDQLIADKNKVKQKEKKLFLSLKILEGKKLITQDIQSLGESYKLKTTDYQHNQLDRLQVILTDVDVQRDKITGSNIELKQLLRFKQTLNLASEGINNVAHCIKSLESSIDAITANTQSDLQQMLKSINRQISRKSFSKLFDKRKEQAFELLKQQLLQAFNMLSEGESLEVKTVVDQWKVENTAILKQRRGLSIFNHRKVKSTASEKFLGEFENNYCHVVFKR